MAFALDDGGQVRDRLGRPTRLSGKVGEATRNNRGRW